MGHRDVQAGPPDYVGVGAQDAGGEWWHALLLQHPEIRSVDRGRRGFFDAFCTREMQDADVARYHATFRRRNGTVTGEWRPRYMYDVWTPRLLHRAAPEARLLAIVRDPIARYRAALADQDENISIRRKRLAATDAIERGRYATQLRRLLRFFPAERILVLQYERCLADPAGEYARTLRFLGVRADVRPQLADPPDGEGEGPELWPDLAAALHRTYEPEVRDLAALVDHLDLSLWPAFAPARRRRGLLARLGR